LKSRSVFVFTLYTASVFGIIVVTVQNPHQKLSINISLFLITGWFSQWPFIKGLTVNHFWIQIYCIHRPCINMFSTDYTDYTDYTWIQMSICHHIGNVLSPEKSDYLYSYWYLSIIRHYNNMYAKRGNSWSPTRANKFGCCQHSSDWLLVL